MAKSNAAQSHTFTGKPLYVPGKASLVYLAVHDWLDRTQVDRLFYDHLPHGMEQTNQPEIIRAFSQLQREGFIAKFVTCEDGIVFLRGTAKNEMAQ